MAKLTEEQIKLLEKADRPAVMIYRIKKDCSSCDFDESYDRFYCAFDPDGDIGKKPHGYICRYEITIEYKDISKLAGDEILTKKEAEEKLAELNHKYACALKYYDRDPLYTSNVELMAPITEEEAKEVINNLNEQ